MTPPTSRRWLPTLAAAALVTLGLTLAGAGPASAHVTVTSDSAEAGAYAVLTFSIPHGCDGSATTALSIQIPEGIDAVTPTRNPYYEVAAIAEELAEPVVDSHGNEATTRVAEVRYTATTPLPDGYRDTVELSLLLPAEAAGSTLYFPTVQTCEKGETAWIEIPAQGQDPAELAAPAPALDVVAGAAGAESEAEPTAAQAAVEPSQRENGAPLRVAVLALVIGTAALVLGGLALLRPRARR